MSEGQPLEKPGADAIPRPVGEARVKRLIPPAVAVLASAALLVAATYASTSYEELVQHVGVAGQVIFAGLVWWIGLQQFKLSKAFNDTQAALATKQLRVDAFDKRHRAYTSWQSLAFRIGRHDYEESDAFELSRITNEIEHVFSKQATSATEQVAELAWEMVVLREKKAEFEGPEEDRRALNSELISVRKRVRQAVSATDRMMREELRLGE